MFKLFVIPPNKAKNLKQDFFGKLTYFFVQIKIDLKTNDSTYGFKCTCTNL